MTCFRIGWCWSEVWILLKFALKTPCFIGGCLFRFRKSCLINVRNQSTSSMLSSRVSRRAPGVNINIRPTVISVWLTAAPRRIWDDWWRQNSLKIIATSFMLVWYLILEYDILFCGMHACVKGIVVYSVIKTQFYVFVGFSDFSMFFECVDGRYS